MEIRERLRMDEGWKFHLGDVEPPKINPLAIIEVYRATKSQRGRGAAAKEYNDSAWRTVDLPHDYAAEGTPTPDAMSSNASLPRQNAWYRRYFRLSESDRGRRITLAFDGVATHCTVWVNGHLMMRHFGGYNGFEIDVSDIVTFGEAANAVAVRVQNEEFEGWFYEGAGIYRHVWLNKTNPLCVDSCGTYIVSEKNGSRWTSTVETTVRNDLYEDRTAVLRSAIVDAGGRELTAAEEPFTAAARSVCTLHTVLQTENPALWSLESPNLYTLVTQILEGGRAADRYETRFGFRTLRFDADEGFFLNDRHVKITGVCAHEDFGGQGAAYSDNLRRYRIRQLKKMGCNGYRTAHNPHSPELMDICDEEGMLVMDENRWFESWGEGTAQLKNLVRRDRNHPCVIFWSLGNEEPIQAFETGKNVARAMRQTIRQLDRTRPVMMAMHTGLLNGQATSVSDVIGANYNHRLLDEVHRANPGSPIIGSENYSLSDEPEADRQSGIETWELVRTRGYLSGYFIWTGIDYRGEHRYPSLLATCGGLDINCQPKDDFYAYQALWRAEPAVRICPHWNLTPDRDGRVQIFVYTNAQTVELVLNGKTVARRENGPYDLSPWSVRYEPGELRAIARNGGVVVAEHAVRTAGAAAKLVLSVENGPVRANREDSALIRAVVVDAAGTPVPNAEYRVRFSCSGAGTLLSTCSGYEKDQVPCPSPERMTWRGQCTAVVRVAAGQSPLVVRAEAEGLQSGSIEVPLVKAEPRPFAEAAESSSLRGWRLSPVWDEKPDMEAVMRDGPDAAWKSTEVGVGYQPEFYHLEGAASYERVRKYAVYYLRTRTPKRADGRLSLHFEEVNGRLDVWILQGNRRFFGAKDTYEAGHLDVDAGGCLPGEEAGIYALLETEEASSGIMQPVTWEIK